MAHTKADIISTLRSRNVKGPLTKMKKAKLLQMLKDTAPPSSPRDVHDTGIYLAPDPEHKQTGGHAYKVDGSLGSNHGAKHTHEKKDWPGDKPTQKGRGRGDSDYNRFIRAEMKQNGGKMALAAKAWREHKQSGGHFARKDGTVSDSEKKKYKHSHEGLNPSTNKTEKPKQVEAPNQDEKPSAVEKPKAVEKPVNKPKAKAPAPKPKPKPKPRDLSKIPDSLLTDAERKQKKAQADALAAADNAASRERRRKVAAREKRAREKGQEADRQYTERVRKRQAGKESQKAKDKDAVKEARKRLKADEYSKYRGLAEFKKIEDQMTVSNKAKPSIDLVKETLRTRKDLRTSKAERDESERNERAVMDLDRERETERRYGTRSSGKIQKKQEGSGMTLAEQLAEVETDIQRVQLQQDRHGAYGDLPDRDKFAEMSDKLDGLMDVKYAIMKAQKSTSVLRENRGVGTDVAEKIAQGGSGVDLDMTDLPDSMTNEQIADMLVDQGIARMQSDPIEARQDFEHALTLDPEYTLAQEYIDTINGQVEDAHRRLAFAQTDGLNADVMERVNEHLGSGDDQVGGSFWGSAWSDVKDIAEVGGAVALGVATGGLGDLAIGTLGVAGEMAAEAATGVAETAAESATAAAQTAVRTATETGESALQGAADTATSTADRVANPLRGAMDNAQGLSDSHINSFLDESAEAGGVDARVTQPAPQRGMSTTDTERPQYGASTVEDEAQRQVAVDKRIAELKKDPNETKWLKLDRRQGFRGRSSEYMRRSIKATGTKLRKEGLAGVAKESGKLYATGKLLGAADDDDGDNTPGDDGGKLADEFEREAQQRASEARALGVTQMYADNRRALNPYAHS